MSLYLLDSDAVIDYLKGVSTANETIRRLSQRGDTLCHCDIVVTEVGAGLPPASRRATYDVLDGLTYLPTSQDAARLAGEWRYNYARRGVIISTADALIAATAYEHDATLITRNARHFPMPELRVVSTSGQERQ